MIQSAATFWIFTVGIAWAVAATLAFFLWFSKSQTFGFNPLWLRVFAIVAALLESSFLLFVANTGPFKHGVEHLVAFPLLVLVFYLTAQYVLTRKAQ